MLNFELSKTKPKLQNNHIVALQTRRQYLPVFLFMLLLCNTILYSQDLPTKNEVTIPSEEIQDSITVPIKPIISEINEAVTDTVKTDSIKPQKETLTDVVDYYGEDYVYMNQKERKVYMRNKAYVIYGDMRIDAGLIILDYNKNEVYAKGIDSAGVYSQSPKFKQGANEVKPDSIRFNFDTEKALIYNSRTEQNGFNVIAEITKRENDSVVYLQNVKFTTSKNIDDPEYYFYTRRAKFVPKKKIVTGLTNMYIADVPTPIGLPFAFFPLTEDRASGVIIPTIGDNGSRGFFFQNGGYYFAVNDFLDLTVLGDYYTNGSYGLRAESTYAVRYKYRGNVSLRYENLIDSERGFDDFAQSTVYNIRWSHSQDTKASPNSRFSASVNLGSSRYFQESINQTNNASALVNTLSSSVSYSKTFEGEPQVNTAISATHSQNTNTQQITMSLPSVTTSVSRIFPFAPKAGVKKGIIDNINLQYDFTGDNRINTVDSLFFKKEMFDNALVGMRHRIPVSTNFKVLKYLSASANTTYQETWTLKTFDKSYDATANDGDGGVVTDTISGFDSYRTYNFSTSLGTTVYGTFNFGKKRKVQAVRHVMRPNVSYNINPGFNQYYDEYNIPVVSADPDINEEVVEYSRFEGTLYGAPGQTSTSSIGLSLSNTLEAKVRDKDTTATEAKKVVLLNNLNFGTSYNLRGDSLNWSPVSFSGSIPIIPKLDLNFSGSLDPYALDNNNQRIDQFNIDNGGSLFRLTGANISVNYNFSSKDFEGKKEDDFENDTFRNGGRPDDLFGDATNINDGQIFADDSDSEVDENRDWYNYSLPWDLRVAYTMSYSNSIRQNEISSQSLMFSSNVELSPRWKVGMSSGYDFKNKGVTLTQFRFQRDLESWQMSFNWTPIGSINTSWYFFVGIKSSVLSDIKYDKRREPDKNF
ncbi:putative LPS assembly protein LptD [Ulvibacter litoralis]|uniref:LPS assembly outer membrane protein LptD (Organic solvent tolerance protein OstA) n=1 Tax=Ulvibacter litoralis TaxID=227084 RepID=A0A1G7FQP2_9FLAO|nr:putative LPS assembly protein LptD [Ulvibacter litoralis]SDE78256.1 LPS assembly outer membrane protein LptD (organic solvent tolerance protein OstA) [Ulvibacter litoralis]